MVVESDGEAVVEVGTGRRNVCDLCLVETPELDIELEAGDVLVAKNDKSRLSKFIASRDGWWTHTAMSLGGDRIIHSYSKGISTGTLQDLSKHYEAGMAAARFDLPIEVREHAASVAEGLSQQPNEYSADDLGIAFSLLWRAGKQPTERELKALVDDDGGLLGPGAVRPYARTCSGFVYSCYEAAMQPDDPPRIKPAPGIRVNDENELWVPNREQLIAELKAKQQRSTALLSGAGERVGELLRHAGIGAKGLASFGRVYDLEDPVPMEKGVSPADMWTAPQITKRWFIYGRDIAVAAVHAGSTDGERS